mgnify:CR=1 FL=1
MHVAYWHHQAVSSVYSSIILFYTNGYLGLQINRHDFFGQLLLLLRRRNIELEVNNITILDNVSLTLLPVLPRRLNWRHRLLAVAEVVEVLVRYDLGLDEAALEVAVDNASCLRGVRSLLDRPAADLLLTGGEVILEAELGETCRVC